MLSDLLASARELRNPLTVGYSALLTFWLIAGEAVGQAARANSLGRRLVTALDSMGEATKLALLTFVAALIGSLLWSVAVSRLVRFLSMRSGHPDWTAMIEEAREAVRRYEEYDVTTHKGWSSGKPSQFDQRHRVPSPRHSAFLQERVDERQRKAAEMSFRVTLAVSLVPPALSLGIKGGGMWWWSLAVIPILWFDVALMKHTTLGTVHRYELEDTRARLAQAERNLADSKARAAQTASVGAPPNPAAAEANLQYQGGLDAEIEALRGTEAQLLLEQSQGLSRIFRFLLGPATD